MTTDETLSAAVDQVQAAVSALVEDIFSALDRIAAGTTTLWDQLEGGGTTPRAADLDALRDVVIAELQRFGPMFNGAGVVVDDDMLADRRTYLEWWRPDPASGSPQRLRLDLNPQSEYFYDYLTMEWFTGPRDHDRRWVYGPYLDFTGVDLYVCTFSVPVRAHGDTFVGVAGADVPVVSIDAALMPVFRQGGRPLALVNAEGRVIVANHPDHLTGSRLRASAATRTRAIPGTPWALVAVGAD